MLVSTLAAADNGVLTAAETPIEQWTEEHVWDTEHTLELALAPAGDWDSGSPQNNKIPQHCPHIKEITCPLSHRASKVWSFW